MRAVIFPESDDIGKEDGGTLVMISDVAFTVAKASGNLGRQDVPSTKSRNALFCLLDPGQIFGLHRPQTSFAAGPSNARAEDGRVERLRQIVVSAELDAF